jgi:dienelactone hydrolase
VDGTVSRGDRSRQEEEEALVILAPIITAATASSVAPTGATPPGQPGKGFGSRQAYICRGYRRLTGGSTWDGTRVTVYVPDRLKDGDKAPVMVFLHGFMMAAQQAYIDLIRHSVFQGTVVICPGINVGDPLRIAVDTDQNVMMRRAIANANRGFSMAGSMSDMDKVVVVGHSLGALLGACWIGAGGARPGALVLGNPSTDSKAGIPGFVSRFVKIKPIDWKAKAKEVNVPVTILTGDQDSIAPESQAIDLYRELTGAPSRAVYCLRGDNHGRPCLRADHNAMMCRGVFVPSFMMNMVGGKARVDAADYRYYWAAVDAAFAGVIYPRFHMGNWSDGETVKPVARLAPPGVLPI